jgi:hypothetical protein
MLWDIRFREHDLWLAVETARESMNAAAQPEDRTDLDALDYAGMVLELLEQRRSDTDGREVSPAMLESTRNAVNTFASHVELVRTGQYSWAQTVGAADDVVSTLASWPPMKPAKWLAGINSSVESFQRRALGATEAVEARAQEVRDNLDTISTEQQTLETSVEEQRQRISEAIASFTSRGDAAVSEWTAEHEEEITRRADAWDAALAGARAEAETHRTQMAEYEAKSRKVLEAVGGNATATDFGIYANEQMKAADQWRKVAVAVFVVAGAWFIASSFPWFTPDGELWESALARLGVTAAVAGVGLYTARESSQHRKEERRAKEVQLVLTALEPFIANMTLEDQNQLRVASAEAIFVLSDPRGGARDAESTSDFVALASSLIAKIPDRT